MITLALLAGLANASELRALHLSPDAPPVDVFVNELTPAAVTDLGFTEGTGYLPVPAGTVNVKVAASPGTPGAAVLDVDLPIPAGVAVSAVAFDTLAGIQALALIDDDAGIANGDVRLQVSHTAVGVGDVNVIVRGLGTVSEDFAFGETFTADLPAGPIDVGLDTDLDGNPDWLFAVPNLGSDALVNVFAATDATGQPFLLAWLPDGSTARVDGVFREPAETRIVHLSPDAPSVDVFVDGAMVVEDLAYGDVAAGLPVPAGRRDVAVLVSGTQDVVFSGQRRFRSGNESSIVAYGELANIQAGELSKPACNPGLLCANVAHAADGVGVVDILEVTSGSVLLPGVPYGGTGVLRVPSGAYTVGLDTNGDGSSEFTFDVPDVGAQTVDVFAVLDAIGPYLQVVLEDGTPVRIDPN